MSAPDRLVMDFGYVPSKDGIAVFEAWDNPTEYIRKDLCTPTDEQVKALVDAIQDALGRYQVTHIHEVLTAALRNIEEPK